MVFTKQETLDIEKVKHDNKVIFENLRHENRIAELEKEIKLAKITAKMEIVDG